MGGLLAGSGALASTLRGWVAVALTFEVEDVGVMEKAIHRGGGEERVAEEARDLPLVAVAGDDDGASLVAETSDLEEVVGLVVGERAKTEGV